MARYKNYSYEQTKMIPLCLPEQIRPGTFEYALNYIVDNELDLSVFEKRYKNDETGAPAFDPAILLKIVLSPRLVYTQRDNIEYMEILRNLHSALLGIS